ncbi:MULTISPECIES: GNAT family N-acetyltransferase [Gammaproteobacteria]|uniref:GNAT family N-acetyltransferase n=1 Tax=Gammaproteobacteria TaxID=1236 RepID=UPI000DD0ED20|nr:MULTISPECIES: GNAT family N-acetyltransferase [Gammaproteobacteria]RTE87752.1 GNAT family N-acetyltransferase [Aliidiomarina sp. B3213]TCZ92466.1 GNAT family N-acetyltransferase [Lysobacter sp. N42]
MNRPEAQSYVIETAKNEHFDAVGELLVQVYSALDGFPSPDEQPKYYAMLRNVGDLTEEPTIDILIAKTHDNSILGAVVFFSDMKHYGSGGTATQEKDAAGFRLLAVSPTARGLGLGKALTEACIQRAKNMGRKQVVIHSTRAMQVAWHLYENIGFQRSTDLDFKQESLPVFGFRLTL